MAFLNEYGGFINFGILIGLAIFLFNKMKSIDYSYFIATFFKALWELVLEIIRLKNRISHRDKLKNFFSSLPEIDKVPFARNILIFYVGCLVLGTLEIIRFKHKFGFIDFFVGRPSSYFFGTIALIAFYFIMKVVVIPILKGINEKAKNADYSGFEKNFGGGRSSARSFTSKKPNTPTPINKTSNTVKKETNVNKGPDMRNDSTERKMCAMCSFWTGNREFLDAGRKTFKYEEGSAKCSGARRGVNMNARAGNMPCFQKWGG
jgi:hypothetical protein